MYIYVCVCVCTRAYSWLKSTRFRFRPSNIFRHKYMLFSKNVLSNDVGPAGSFEEEEDTDGGATRELSIRSRISVRQAGREKG